MKTLILALVLALPVTAATRTWNGSVSTAWSEPANWDEHAVPADGDDLVFPRNANVPSVNDLQAGLIVHSITINTNGVRIGGSSITLDAGGVTVNNQFVTSIISGAMNFTAVNLKSSQTWSGSAHPELLNVGPLNLNGKTLTISGGSYGFTSLVGGGSIVNFGGGGISGGVWNGSLTVDSGLFGLYGGAGAGDVNVNGGTLQVIGGSPHDITVNAGGTLDISNFSNSGPSKSGSITIVPAGSVPTNVHIGFSVFNSIIDSITGTLALNNAKLSINGSAPNVAGSTLILFSNDGHDSVDGTFMGLPEGAIINTGGTSDQISYHGGDGNDVSLTVLDALVPSTTIALTSSTNPSLPEQPVTFTATVNASQGNVDFFDGTFRVGTAPLDASGRAALTLPLGAGTHTITAAYTGTPSNATSQTTLEQRVIGRRHATR